jgi:outer membrane protein assembly factor BamB
LETDGILPQALRKAIALIAKKVWFGLAWLFSLTLSIDVVSAAEDNWPSWRGPNLDGTSKTAEPPTTWGADQNVAWKAKLSGLGSSTPIVWDHQVIVLFSRPIESDASASGESLAVFPTRPTGYSTQLEFPGNRAVGRSIEGDLPRFSRNEPIVRTNKRHEFVVASFHLETGEPLWETVVVEDYPHEGRHEANNFASSSPVTDGQSIYVFFGSRGVFRLSMEGQLQWHFDHGQLRMLNSWGEAASPALMDNTLIIPWDNEGESNVIAMIADSGYIKWKVPRNESSNWSTPLLVEHDGVKQAILNGRIVRSYALETGQLLWSCPGQTYQAIPTPFKMGGYVYVTSGHQGVSGFSISLSAKGMIPEGSDSIAWQSPEHAPYVTSPCWHDGKIYAFNDTKSMLAVMDSKTGKPILEPRRLNVFDKVYSSHGIAGGKLYLTDSLGATVVLDASSLEPIATNELDDKFCASPVFVGRRLLLRGQTHLYCLVSEDDAEKSAPQ